jgi:outer membrane protein with beta-barrel domain
MRLGLQRFAVGAFAVLILLFVTVSSAAAQSDETTALSATSATVTADAVVPTPTITRLPANVFRPRLNATFQPPAQNVGRRDSTQSGVGVGVVFGLVRNNLSTGSTNNFFTARTGTLLGLWIGGNKNGTVGFVGEFLWVRRKSGAGTDELTQQALEIPAVFHINFGSHARNGAQGYIVIGPAFTINVKESLKSGVTGNNFGSADIGIMFGAGFEVVRLAIEVRGNWGQKSISSDGGGSFVDAKTRSVEIVGKFRFN